MILYYGVVLVALGVIAVGLASDHIHAQERINATVVIVDSTTPNGTNPDPNNNTGPGPDPDPDPGDDPDSPLVTPPRGGSSSGGGGGGGVFGGSFGGGNRAGGGSGFFMVPILAIYDFCDDDPKVRLVAASYRPSIYAQLVTLHDTYAGVLVSIHPDTYVVNTVDANIHIFDFQLDSADDSDVFTIIISDLTGRDVRHPVTTDRCSGYEELFDATGIDIVRPVNTDLTFARVIQPAPPPPAAMPEDTVTSVFLYDGINYTITHDSQIVIRYVDVDREENTITFTLAEPVSGTLTLVVSEDLIRGTDMILAKDRPLAAVISGNSTQINFPSNTTEFTLSGSYVAPEFGTVVFVVLGASFALVASMRRYLPLASN